MVGNTSGPVTAGMSSAQLRHVTTAPPNDTSDYFENYVSFDEILQRGLLGDIGPGEWYMVYSAVCLVLEQVVCLFGVVGNSLTLYIMSQPALSYSVTSVLLRYLAAADLLRLFDIVVMNNPLIRLFFDLTEIDFFCKVHQFLLFLCGHLSSCALIPISLERFAAVCFPFKVKQIFTKKRALILIACMTLFLMAVNGFLLVVSGVIDTEYGSFCDIADENVLPFMANVYPWIDMTLYFFLPFLIIVTCNSAIVFRLVQQRMSKSKITSNSDSASKKISSMTRMLLYVSLAFLVLVSPLLIYFLLVNPVDQAGWTPAETALKLSVLHTLVLLSSTNHAINFILYCGAIPKFREELRKRLGCKIKTKVGPVQSGSSGKQDQSQSKETKDTFVQSSRS